MQYTKEKGSYVYKLKITDDITCIVAWHLGGGRTEYNPKRLKKTAGGIGMRQQRLKPSTNQYRWCGHIYGGDETKKSFYSDNVKLVQHLTYNHALQLMKQRIKRYTQVLEGSK